MTYLNDALLNNIAHELGLEFFSTNLQQKFTRNIFPHYVWAVYLSHLTIEEKYIYRVLGFVKTSGWSRGMIASLDEKLNLIKPKTINLEKWEDVVVDKLQKVDVVSSLSNNSIWDGLDQKCEIAFRTQTSWGHFGFMDSYVSSSNLRILWDTLINVSEEFRKLPPDTSFRR